MKPKLAPKMEVSAPLNIVTNPNIISKYAEEEIKRFETLGFSNNDLYKKYSKYIYNIVALIEDKNILSILFSFTTSNVTKFNTIIKLHVITVNNLLFTFFRRVKK